MMQKIATFDFRDYFVLPVPFDEMVNGYLSNALRYPKMNGNFSPFLTLDVKIKLIKAKTQK